MGARKKEEKKKKAKATGRTPESYNDQLGENPSEGRLEREYKAKSTP